ncbi:hypothetical protein [Microbacterium sp. NPDC096154]|uniref:restriction endonuclease subunit S n=1 Tax=Microbacterium sp. NPDC096154 TaxID=3155549 RepID=UPI00333492EA
MNSDESCYLPMEAISEFGAIDSSRMRPTTELAQGYSFVADGDVAYAKVTPCFENGKGLRAAGLPGGYAFATTEITVMRPSRQLDSRYLSWVLQSEDFRAPGEAHMSGAGGLKRVPESYAAKYRVSHPRVEIQRAIADYLDRETAQIDAFIAKNEELITLLAERRAAFIDHAFERLGAGPTRLKYCASIQTGVTLSGDGDPADPEWPYLRVANVQVGRVDLDEIKTIRVSEARARQSMLSEGDVLMTEGGDRDKLGRGALWSGEIKPMLHQNHVFAVKLRSNLDGRFLMRWLDASPSRRYFETTAVQTTNLASTNKTLVGNLPVPFCSVAAQLELVGALDLRLERLDAAVRVAEQSVRLARERRAALISAAVTGKIDVGVAG